MKLFSRHTIMLTTLLFGVLCACGRHTPMHQRRVQLQASGSTAALFEERASLSNINFVHTNGADGHLRYVETTPAGCAFVDYDNDGYLDILLIQSGASRPLAPGEKRPFCALYHNKGDGTFVDVTLRSGLDKDLGYAQGVAIGDYDNDGFDDIFITGYRANFLFHNEHGTGRFIDTTIKMKMNQPQRPGYATSAAFGDFDHDGRLDLYVCNYCEWSLDQDKACHDAQGMADYCTPELYRPEIHQLWHNDGDHFTDVTHKSGIDRLPGRGLAACFADFNGDGRQDIFVANDLSPNRLWRNNGDGTFTDSALAAGVAYGESGQLMSGMGIGLCDYDRSGRESLFVTNFTDKPNMLYKNEGGGNFRDVSYESGVAIPHMRFLSFGCEFLDYDADSWPDLITANGHVQVHPATPLAGVTYAERKQLLHNTGRGTFQEVTDPNLLGDLAAPTVARGLATGDYDNDGRLDVLVNNQNGPAQLFHNRDQSSNHWVSFKTVGTQSNRDGYGTVIALKAGPVHLVSSVHSGTSYLSHSDRRAYFGLGSERSIDSVEIRWPSGRTDIVKRVACDQSYIVTEGRGITDTLPRALKSKH